MKLNAAKLKSDKLKKFITTKIISHKQRKSEYTVYQKLATEADHEPRIVSSAKKTMARTGTPGASKTPLQIRVPATPP